MPVMGCFPLFGKLIGISECSPLRMTHYNYSKHNTQTHMQINAQTQIHTCKHTHMEVVRLYLSSVSVWSFWSKHTHKDLHICVCFLTEDGVLFHHQTDPRPPTDPSAVSTQSTLHMQFKRTSQIPQAPLQNKILVIGPTVPL